MVKRSQHLKIKVKKCVDEHKNTFLAPQFVVRFSISPAFPKNVDTHKHHTSSLLPFPLLVAPGHDGAAHPVLLDRQVRLFEVRLAALALLLVVSRHKLAQLRLQLVVGAPRCGVGGVFGMCILNVCPTMWMVGESQAVSLHDDAPIFSSSL